MSGSASYSHTDDTPFYKYDLSLHSFYISIYCSIF